MTLYGKKALPIQNNHIGNIYEDMLTYMIVAFFLYESGIFPI